MDAADDAASDAVLYRLRAPEDFGENAIDGRIIYERRFPLHNALDGSPRTDTDDDEEALRRPTSESEEPDDIVEVIEDFLNEDPKSLRVRDREGYTPLHVAASYLNVRAVQAILAISEDPHACDPLSRLHDDLLCRKNALHATPLELCEAQLALRDAGIDYMRGAAVWKRRLGSVEDGLEVVESLKDAMRNHYGEERMKKEFDF